MSLPPAQKIITDLRKADGNERVAKKTLEAIQKALNPDAKDGEQPDAAALAQALTEREADATRNRPRPNWLSTKRSANTALTPTPP